MFSIDTDPYEVLGVGEKASDAEIKRARRQLVLKYPNEVYPERAQEINKAYQLLIAPEKRRQVDLFLKSKAGCALRVQKTFLSQQVVKDVLDYPERATVFELFKLDSPVSVDRKSLIASLLEITRGADE